MLRVAVVSVALLGLLAVAAPAAGATASVRDGHARFEVVSPTLIRLEYAGDDRFEDGPTMTAVNRAFPAVPVQTFVQGNTRVVRTSAITLRYQRGSGPFTPQNLSIDVSGGASNVQPQWQPDSNPQNLGGWRRGLDEQEGPALMHQGLLSRAGWYLLDDSQTVLVTGGSPGFALRTHSAAYQDGYFFGYGHDYARGLADLRRLTGAAPLLPRKAFGVWFSRYYAYSAADLQALLDQFRANRVPLAMLSVDTDWKRESNPAFGPIASTIAGGSPTQPYAWNGWEWNTSEFPDPRGFLSWAHSQGLAVTLNAHPSMNGDDPQFKDTNARAGGLKRDTTGSCAVLVATPSGCFVFDWTDPRQLDAYFSLHDPIESDGVDFWWLDWCCDSSSADAPGLSADTWINSRYAERNFRRGSRWPVFSRIGASLQGPGPDGDDGEGDGGAGAFAEHRYAIHFTGDTCATWPMLAFESQFTAEEGNIGLPYVSHDIGSFNGPPPSGGCANNPNAKVPDDLYVRWVQFGTFQPFDRLHSNHGARLPWEYPAPAGPVAADFLRLREQLVPYLYTLAREAHDTGLPMTRALYLEWPDSAAAYANPTEYTLGRDMLVAPVTAPGDPASQSVWIPPGTWTDWFTGERFSGPRTVQMQVPLSRYPVFVRAGAIVPTGDAPVLNAWAGAPGSFDLYEDAGDGLGYRSGAYRKTRVSTNGASGACSSVKIGPARGSFAGAPSSRSWRVRLVGVAAPRTVTVNGVTAGRKAWTYDPVTRTLTVKTGSLPTKAAAEIGTASPLRVRVRRPRGARIVRVDAYVGKRRVLRVRRNGIRT
ncbi:MAG: TIM-barrel domain-containing protein, partial [Thermoleophilaceae bacterium]